eukprot:gene26652-32206_t
MTRSHDDEINPSRPAQILEFIDPSTNTPVVLIGAMHYNPTSIALAKDTIRNLAENDELGAIVIESCPIRWNRTTELLDNVVYARLDKVDSKPLLRSVLYNEMLAAAEMGKEYNIPVILGDQLINVTNTRIKDAFISSVKDILSPQSGGWRRLYEDIKIAYTSSAPTGPGYLNSQDFFDLKLLLLTPVTLVKYPLALILRAPVAIVPFLIFLYITFSSSGISSTDSQDTYLSSALLSGPMDMYGLVFSKLQDLLYTVGVYAVELGVLGRVFLVSILAERNVVLAKSIQLQCARLAYSDSKVSSPAVSSPLAGIKEWWRKNTSGNARLPSSSSPHAEASTGIRNNKPKKVVAVLETVEQLPRLKQLKAVLLDAEYARIVDVSWLRRAYPTSFIAIYDPSAAFNPFFRLSCFEAGANMVGHDVASIATALTRAVLPPKGNGAFTCPYCRLGGLTEGEMHMHIPTYHINWPYEVHVTSQCPICRKALHRTPLQVHIHEEHQPQQPVASSSSHSYSSLALPYSPSTSLNNPSYMPQPHTPSPPSITQLYHFALVLVRHPQYPKYLLVQEFGNLGFW